MIVYILRRLGATFIVMAVVALVVFSLLFLTPGDPAAVIAGDIATDADIKNILVSANKITGRAEKIEKVELAPPEALKNLP